MAQFFRDFSGQAHGSTPWNTSFPWATPTVGQINTSTFGYPVYEESHSGNTEVPLVFGEVPASATLEIVMRTRMTHVDTGSGFNYQSNAVLRGSGNNAGKTGYTVNMLRGQYVNTEGYNGGSSFSFGPGSSFSFAANTWYWLRARVSGTTVQYKAWADGSPEPGSWQSATSSTVNGAGFAAIGSWQGTGTRYYSHVGIGTNGDSAPTSAVNTTLAVNNVGITTSLSSPTLSTSHTPVVILGMIYGGWGGAMHGGTPYASGPNLLQNIINAADMQVDVSMQAVALVQQHMLSISESIVGTTIDNISLLQEHILGIDDIILETDSTNVDLGTEAILGTSPILVGTTSTEIALIQHYTLDIDDIVTNTTTDNVVMIQGYSIQPDAITVPTSTSTVNLIMQYILDMDNMSVNTTIDDINLVQNHILQTLDVITETSLSSPELIVIQPLQVDDIIVPVIVEKLSDRMNIYVPGFTTGGVLEQAEIDGEGILIPSFSRNGEFEQFAEEYSGLYIPQQTDKGKL